MSERAFDCYVDLGGRPTLVGRVYAHPQSTVIDLDPDFVTDYGSLDLLGPQDRTSGGQIVTAGLPGAFRDALPDRWGRKLIERAHGRPLDESACLLAVSDSTRQGALRFSAPGAREFLLAGALPERVIALGRLYLASQAVAASHGSQEADAVRELLAAAGGSPGGARPKISVRDRDGVLALAKFPADADAWDVIGMERTILEVAERGGIQTPRSRLHRVDGTGILVLDRFDRDGEVRVPYLSMMSMLRKKDGQSADYADFPDHATGATAIDWGQMLRRVAFSVAVNNTDDHLRNHGLLHDGKRWGLAPIFDVNANPDVHARRRTTILGSDLREDALEALDDLAELYEIGPDQARLIYADINQALGTWRERAVANQVPATTMTLFADVIKPLRTGRDSTPPDVPRARRGRRSAGRTAGGQFAPSPLPSSSNVCDEDGP